MIAAGISVLQGYVNSVVGEGIMRDIRTSFVARIHRMPLNFFTGTKTGEIMNRVSNDVDNVDNIVTGTLTTIVTNVVIDRYDARRDVRLELAASPHLGRSSFR